MVHDKLKVFISSCEHELIDERAIAIDTIEKMGYEAIASENRPASNLSIKKVNLNEVSKCDIYIGIFRTKYSKPTICEYKEAIKNKKPPLIFKKGHNQTDLDPNLSSFLEKVKDPKIGRTIRYFEDVVELSKEIQKSIISLVSIGFRKPYLFDIKPFSDRTMECKDKPKLGYAKIIKFNITDPIQVGTNGKVYAKVKGKADHAFLDLLIINHDKEQFWFPDPHSWDHTLDKGKLTLNEHKPDYSNEWDFSVPKNWPLGSYTVFITMYEDTYYLPTINRRIIAFKEKIINVE